MIVGLLPRPNSNEIYKEYLKEVNDGLMELSQRYGSCVFVPIHKKFLFGRGLVKPGLHIHDGVHLNEAGGKLAADYLVSKSMLSLQLLDYILSASPLQTAVK